MFNVKVDHLIDSYSYFLCIFDDFKLQILTSQMGRGTTDLKFLLANMLPFEQNAICSCKSPLITPHLKKWVHERENLKRRAVISNDVNDWENFIPF